VVALGGTVSVVVIALLGTRAVVEGINPWPRFWATVFFSLLIWPVAIVVIRRVLGRTGQIGLATLAVALTAAQQVGAGTLPIPLVQSWYASLALPGDAVRRELDLPPVGTQKWERAWERASSVAVAICTELPVSNGADVGIELNGGRVVPLASLRRSGGPTEPGWYLLPVTRGQVDARRPLVVELRLDAPAVPPARICGGQDDPTRLDRGKSHRRRAGGAWSADDIADVTLPLIRGLPPPSRFYVELRFFDAAGLPHVGIWY
jgi:hypothetical protein